MRYLKIVTVLILLFSISSCTKIIYTIVAPQKPHFKKFEKCKDGQCKIVVFVTMTHVAKPDFFKKVKQEVLTHKANGYTVFYEGTGTFPKDMENQTKDTVKRKFRKIIKYYAEDYLEYEAFPAYFKENNFVMQTKENTG